MLSNADLAALKDRCLTSLGAGRSIAHANNYVTDLGAEAGTTETPLGGAPNSPAHILHLVKLVEQRRAGKPASKVAPVPPRPVVVQAPKPVPPPPAPEPVVAAPAPLPVEPPAPMVEPVELPEVVEPVVPPPTPPAPSTLEATVEMEVVESLGVQVDPAAPAPTETASPPPAPSPDAPTGGKRGKRGR
jgi:hypothetical protein